MKVYFKRLAFIDGVRYRTGLRDYSGDLKFLPNDAVVDGKKVKDLKEADLKRQQKAAIKEDAKEAKDERKEADEHRNDIVDGSGNVIGKVDETEVDAARVAQEREPTPPPEPNAPPEPTETPKETKVTETKPDTKATDGKTPTAKPSGLDPFNGPASKK